MRAACRVGGIGCLGFVVPNRSGGPCYLRSLLHTFTLVVDIGALPATLVRRHGTPTGVGVAAAGKRFGAHLSSLVVIYLPQPPWSPVGRWTSPSAAPWGSTD